MYGSDTNADVIWPSLPVKVVDCVTTDRKFGGHRQILPVIQSWNNIPRNQDGTGGTFQFSGFSVVRAGYYCGSTPSRKPAIYFRSSDLGGDEGGGFALGKTSYSYRLQRGWCFWFRWYCWDIYYPCYTYTFHHATAELNTNNDASGISDPVWQSVVCHEMGHGFGLEHSNGIVANEGCPRYGVVDTNSCMDTCLKPAVIAGNRYPNWNDGRLLNTKYPTPFRTRTRGLTGAGGFNDSEAIVDDDIDDIDDIEDDDLGHVEETYYVLKTTTIMISPEGIISETTVSTLLLK